MQRFLYPFLCLFCAFFLFSCEKEEVPAKAAIVIDKQMIQPGEQIKLKSVGGDALYYEWDLGYFNSAIGQEVVTSFEYPGWYTIRLKTTGHNKNISEATVKVLVGDVYISGFTIHNFNFWDPDGNLWDSDGTDPDILFLAGGFPGADRAFNMHPNLSQRNLPLSLPIVHTKLPNHTINFTLKEYEQQTSNTRLIKNWQVNPYQMLLESQSHLNFLPGTFPLVSVDLYIQ